jgi:hypothetical protein
VKLAPCGKAVTRFVDTEGKPLPSRKPMMFQLVITPGHLASGEAIVKGQVIADAVGVSAPATDAEGRITFADLIPGATYRIVGPTPTGYGVKKDFTVEAGQTLMLPDLVMDR